MRIRLLGLYMCFLFFLSLFPVFCFAQGFGQKQGPVITILFTGETHSALYHCDCPKEPDGGLPRRLSKIKEIRQANPNTLLVDSGGFFAGGIYDEYSQGVMLDKIRSAINLEALNLINYDALNVGDAEFNLGRDFFLESMAKSQSPFLSANLKLAGVKPYIIKKLANINIAVIGLTNDEPKIKSEGLGLEDAIESLRKSIREAKAEKADFILVLSYLGEEEDKKLLGKAQGIDIIISGRPQDTNQPYMKVGSVILLRPTWQGRRLGKLDIKIQGGKIKDFGVEQIRLSGEITPDPEILKILPQCFSDSDCRRDGLSGLCENPGSKESACVYAKPKKVGLLVVNNQNLYTPNQEKFIEFLKSLFPGLDSRYINYESPEGRVWLAKTRVKMLPIYLLDKEAQDEKGFEKLSKYLKAEGDYYYISPQVSGVSFFVGRKKIDKRLDVFLSTREKNLGGILSVLKQLQAKHSDWVINIHFLAIEDEKKNFTAPGGLTEVEEDFRQVCLKRYYPDKFFDYAVCRAKNPESSWWDTCADEAGIDTAVIKKCCFSGEGFERLRENTRLNQELEISGGPTFLVNNQAVFALSSAPEVEDLEKLVLNAK